MRNTILRCSAPSSKIFDNPSIARFLVSSPKPSALPKESLNEFVFAGRANVGKSSLLNSILGRNNLVKTSSKAGHTRALNFFRVGPNAGKLTLVDAPGYGERGRPEWGEVFEHYLATRQSLRRVFLLINARHGISSSDEFMLRHLDTKFKESAGLSSSYQIVVTKMDSVSVRQLSTVEHEISTGVRELAPTAVPEIIWTSAAQRGGGLGIQRLRDTIVQASHIV